MRPGATEVCNGFDDDCDGSVDEGVAVMGFADRDFDLHGDPEAAAMACPGAAQEQAGPDAGPQSGPTGGDTGGKGGDEQVTDVDFEEVK